MSITTLISSSRLGENRVLVWSAAREELREQNGGEKSGQSGSLKKKKKKNDFAANKLPDHQLARALTRASCLQGGGEGERLRGASIPLSVRCAAMAV